MFLVGLNLSYSDSSSFATTLTLTSTDDNATSSKRSDSNLEFFTVISTTCIISCFVFIALCGCIDATFYRRNEIFSMGAIISATTYTVDIVSGTARIYICLCLTALRFH